MRKKTRINPSNLKYHLSQLVHYGYLKIIGGNKYKTGYEYELSNKEEYIKLTQSVGNALDGALKSLKLLKLVDNSG